MRVTDQLTSPIDVDVRPGAPAQRAPQLRIGIEFVLLFAAAFVLEHVILAGASTSFPSPYWLPVVVLSLQYGMTMGLVAAAIAAGLSIWGGLPPAAVTEDVYAYVTRIAAQPAAWTCVALLIGHTRTREIERAIELDARLAEEMKHSAAVAQLCAELRQRSHMLERHIAANANSSVIDVAEAITGLYETRWDSIAERIARFNVLMMGTAEYSVYLLRGNALKLVFPHEGQCQQALSVTVEPDSALYAAIVKERRTLTASRPADLELLGDRSLVMGPLTDQGASGHVIGMLVIGGADLADFPADIERRFALTCAQLSRLFNRVILIDHWQTDPLAIRAIDRPQDLPYRAEIAVPDDASSSTAEIVQVAS
jgi:hypothetical protein